MESLKANRFKDCDTSDKHLPTGMRFCHSLHTVYVHACHDTAISTSHVRARGVKQLVLCVCVCRHRRRQHNNYHADLDF